VSSPPDHPRWKPHRGGLINLFKYEDQVFRYENGRLLLRGDNGSGKSRVLALQLPFLLDGEVSPHRVEPDRDPAKRMEWHLLMDRHERRTGYTWIEFHRRDDGADHYLTLACGMEAQRGGGAPKRWFVVTPERVGLELPLVRDQVPLGRRALIALLEERGTGTLYDKTSEYRAAVDRELFQLGNRYAPLIELLLQLRQPQLMRDMKEDRLSDALGEALPPVGEDLVAEVAESFQSLDADRESFEAHREMRDSVETFRDGYRQYLAVAVRRLVAVVRTGQSRFEQAARELRALASSIEENERALKAREAAACEAESRRAAAETRVETLRKSPEMRGKQQLDEARRRADEREADAARAGRDHERAGRELDARRREREEAEARHAGQAAEVERLRRGLAAAAADLGAADLFAGKQAPPGKPALEAWLDERRRAVAHLEQILRELAAREATLRETRQRAEGLREDAATQAERAADAESALAAALDDFVTRLAAWEGSLKVLHAAAFPRDRDRTWEMEGWLERREGEPPFDRELAAAREQVAREQAAGRSRLETESAAREAAIAKLRDELRQLREGRQPEPPPPPVRATREADRPGAPLWKLCDFRDTVPDAERGGWEAALQASGLLDAWVMPDGRLLDNADGDDFLLPAGGELTRDHSLAAVLDAADPSAGAVLRRIGCHPDAGPCWVHRDGRWANGPHAGRWRKDTPEYLGHAAREAARRRRIAALEAEEKQSAAGLADLATQLEALAAAEAKLGEECAAAPATAPLREAAIQLDEARRAHAAARQRLDAAEREVAAAGAKRDETAGRRDRDAADLGLTSHAAPDALAAFKNGLHDFSAGLQGFWPRCESLDRQAAELSRSRERESQAIEHERERADTAAERRRLATSARTEADTLAESIGADVEAILQRLAGAEAAVASAKDDHQRESKAAERHRIDAARLEEKHREAGERRGEAETDRDQAVRRMGEFVEHGLFAEFDPEFQPERSEFSTTSAVDLARRLEQALRGHADDEDRWNALQAGLDTSFGELADQLGRHSLLPRLDYIDDGRVRVVACEYQGRPRGLRELAGLLELELADRERIFHEREREVIENHLIGEAAGALQQRIRSAEDSVRRMNDELAKATTSSGIQLKFRWEPADPADLRLEAVRRTFLKAGATWTAADRDEIGDFLQQRIRAEREADDTLAWREHLARALDYRGWHRFTILRRQGAEDSWKKLTRRTFGTGSGGEKALTLTVPQFAAAAAHYASAGPLAPRLILLDEAFVAIDAATRGRLMGLLETFDLDYVMTSEREWGTYPTVSGLAIYQLASRPGYDAVAVTRWVWNGREKLRDTARAEERSTDA
jgi:uncharacterized protein (TIGR02680 family)